MTYGFIRYTVTCISAIFKKDILSPVVCGKRILRKRLCKKSDTLEGYSGVGEIEQWGLILVDAK
jgi:hypothetical protein